MPGGEEAVLVGFRGVRSLPDSGLPQGQGFEVLRLDSDPTGAEHLVVALARRPGGSPELFTMMAEDLVGLLDGWAAAAGRKRCSDVSSHASVPGRTS